MNHDLSKTQCPECGQENPARNSSDQIMCDNCGFDEQIAEEEKSVKSTSV